jgi:hypothetical protein
MTPDAAMLSVRYADLLRANGCSDRTIDNYLYSLKGFCNFLGERPLTRANAEDIIAYQVDVAPRGLSDSSVRVATYALRGFFQKVLERSDWNYAKLPRPRRPQRLPEVLSPEEAKQSSKLRPAPGTGPPSCPATVLGFAPTRSSLRGECLHRAPFRAASAQHPDELRTPRRLAIADFVSSIRLFYGSTTHRGAMKY